MKRRNEPNYNSQEWENRKAVEDKKHNPCKYGFEVLPSNYKDNCRYCKQYGKCRLTYSI